MARQLLLAAVLAVALAAALLAAPASAGGAGDLVAAGHLVVRRGGRACRGTVGECTEYLDGEDAEGEGDVAGMATGGSKRRVLQGGSGYIGYDALRRDNVPCSQRGASYYNCQPGAEANPYSRGCSAITQCRG
ncbi:unnamed protein product [Urochloa decumbens]|uniref:Uncharacterized protein n=1 Tax=Urochloa decumbens TaxID=240449 RepID=A0ABC8ZRA1_9POAL